MGRKSIPKETRRDVLVDCRRRCCICYGLNRDTSIKKGQIAHLDGDSSNIKPDNLAFLCLGHHDELDTITSQSKGLTVSEVKEFRSELHEVIEDRWNQPISIADGEVLPRGDEFSGHYVREGEFEEAEFDVRLLPDNRVEVEGFALWGTDRPGGPNIGSVDFESSIDSGSTVYREEYPGGGGYELKLDFGEGKIQARESGKSSQCGLNVRFEGEYRRVGPSSSSST